MMETPRLLLRELQLTDASELEKVLSDPESMKFYPHSFTKAEVIRWIKWNQQNYQTLKHGLWAVIRKEDHLFLGDCGMTIQEIDGVSLPEIVFHIRKEYCNCGYATEAALACIEYCRQNFSYATIYSYSVAKNYASQKVARNIGMSLFKVYQKTDITYHVYKKII